MLRLAFRSLLAHRARNAFTAFSVMLAMMLVTFVVAAQMQTRTRLEFLKGRNNMLVLPTAKMMPRSAQHDLEKLAGVKRVLYMIVLDGATSPDKKTQFVLHATDEGYTTISDQWFYVPRAGIDRWNGERDGALVGRLTAKDLNVKVGSRITIGTRYGPLPIVVSAISPSGYKSTGVLVHYDYFTELFKKQDLVNCFWVEVDPSAEVKSLGKTIDDSYKNTPTPTESVSASANLQAWAKAGRVIPTLLTGAGLIILLATLLVTANTIAIGIRERIPELATLRAIGFRRGWIVRLLITEVAMVCLFGGIIGGVVPLLIFNDVKMSSGMLDLGRVELPPDILGYVALLSLLLALVASVFPAWRASRTDIAGALRAEA